MTKEVETGELNELEQFRQKEIEAIKNDIGYHERKLDRYKKKLALIDDSVAKDNMNG